MPWIEEVKENLNYKKWVGDPKKYDQIGLILFELLKNLGLKKDNKLLDIGCGSLRAGKFFINYLNQHRYFGLEPERWLIDEALKYECSDIESKMPKFNSNQNFDLTVFDEKFDFILANSIFIHASLTEIQKCLEQIFLVLKEDGIFICNFFDGELNKKKWWSYPDAVTYPKKFVEYMVLANGLRFEYINVKYPGEQIWLKISKKD